MIARSNRSRATIPSTKNIPTKRSLSPSSVPPTIDSANPANPNNKPIINKTNEVEPKIKDKA